MLFSFSLYLLIFFECFSRFWYIYHISNIFLIFFLLFSYSFVPLSHFLYQPYIFRIFLIFFIPPHTILYNCHIFVHSSHFSFSSHIYIYFIFFLHFLHASYSLHISPTIVTFFVLSSQFFVPSSNFTFLFIYS